MSREAVRRSPRLRDLTLRPTRLGAGLAVLVVLLWLVGLNYQVNLAYVVAFWLAGFLLVGVLLNILQLLGLQLDIAPPAEVFQGQEAEVLLQPAAGLKPRHRKLCTIARRQVSYVVTGKAHAHLLRCVSAFVELKTTRVEVDGIAVHRCGTGAVRHAFAAIAQGVQFDEKVITAQLLSNEQLQRPCIDLGRDGPALAGEFFLDDCIEINGQAAEQNQADNTELQRPAQPLVKAAGRLFFCRTRGAGSSHGRGLYALYRGSTDARVSGLQPRAKRP